MGLQHLAAHRPADGVTHVQPTGDAGVAGLEDELVERRVSAQEVEILEGCLLIGHKDVGSLAEQVLRVSHTAHGPVERLAAVAAGDADAAETAAQRFEHLLAKQAQSLNGDSGRTVVDAQVYGRGRTDKFAEAEMG